MSTHVFIGGRDRGLEWLRRLDGRGQLPAAVYCLQEDPHEQEQFCAEIQRFCADRSVPCRPRRRLTPEDEAEIASLHLDLLVVMGWRSLVSSRVLEAPRFGAVAVHESLLPRYRGFAPVNWAVINGETETGVTLFYLTAGMDDGDIVAAERIPIPATATAHDVYRQAAQASVRLLEDNFEALLRGTAPRTPQDESEATYTCARTPDDGLIDWSATTRSVHNLVRGLAAPYPGAFCYAGGERYQVWSGEPLEPAPRYAGRIPGRVVRVQSGVGVDVLTGDGVFRVKTAGRPGEAPVTADAIFRSIRLTLTSNQANAARTI